MCLYEIMSKLTWKEATLNQLKLFIRTANSNVFSIKDLSGPVLECIMLQTASQSKSPDRNLDKTLRELRDLNILKHRDDLGSRVYEYIPNNHNEDLVYKDKRSIGHTRIAKCLTRLGILYEEEKIFHDLKHLSYLRLDIFFTLLGQQVAIEFDGIQHQKAVDIWGGDASLNLGQKRDTIKNEYCVENNIILYRITSDIKDVEGHVKQTVRTIVTAQIWKCLWTILIYFRLKYYS